MSAVPTTRIFQWQCQSTLQMYPTPGRLSMLRTDPSRNCMTEVLDRSLNKLLNQLQNQYRRPLWQPSRHHPTRTKSPERLNPEQSILKMTCSNTPFVVLQLSCHRVPLAIKLWSELKLEPNRAWEHGLPSLHCWFYFGPFVGFPWYVMYSKGRTIIVRTVVSKWQKWSHFRISLTRDEDDRVNLQTNHKSYWFWEWSTVQ